MPMIGTFDIACIKKPDGSTAIGRQAVSAPWHLSKPYWDGAVLIVQSVNATAGIFAGDHLAMRVDVGPDAAVLLTSPSASRIHTMPHGEASLEQSLSVAGGGWLEWMPELFIPQRDCRYRQKTSIDVAEGGALYAVETLAPGRVAHGETFAFERVSWLTRLKVANQLILSEHYPLKPSGPSLRDLQMFDHAWYFANALVVSPAISGSQEIRSVIAGWNNQALRIGATGIHATTLLVRLLAVDSVLLKQTLARLRELLAGHAPLLHRSSRKL